MELWCLNAAIDGTMSNVFEGLSEEEKVHKCITEEVQNVMDCCIEKAAALNPRYELGIKAYASENGLINQAFRVRRKQGEEIDLLLNEGGLCAKFVIPDAGILVMIQPDVNNMPPIRKMFVIGCSTKEKSKTDKDSFLPLGGSFGLGKKQLAVSMLRYNYQMTIYTLSEDGSVCCYEPIQQDNIAYLKSDANVSVEDWLAGLFIGPSCLVHVLRFSFCSKKDLWDALTKSHILLTLEGRFLDHVRVHQHGDFVMKAEPSGLCFLNGVPMSSRQNESGHENILRITHTIRDYTDAYRMGRPLPDLQIYEFSDEHLKEAIDSQDSPWAFVLTLFVSDSRVKERVKDLLVRNKRIVILRSIFEELEPFVKDIIADVVYCIDERNEFLKWLYQEERYDQTWNEMYNEVTFPDATYDIIRYLYSVDRKRFPPVLRKTPPHKIPSLLQTLCSMFIKMNKKEIADSILDNVIMYDENTYGIPINQMIRLPDGRYLISTDTQNLLDNVVNIPHVYEHLEGNSSFKINILLECAKQNISPEKPIRALIFADDTGGRDMEERATGGRTTVEAQEIFELLKEARSLLRPT